MIKSPTYTIVREYDGRLPLYHLDVYRIGNDPDSIDLDDFLYGDGVTVIEWGNLLDTQFGHHRAPEPGGHAPARPAPGGGVSPAAGGAGGGCLIFISLVAKSG